jgi:single-stranded-DNA-specific exonuclease
LKDSAKAAKIIREFSERDRYIKVFGHLDADGLSGTGIMAKTLLRLGANFSLRIVKQLDDEVVAGFAKEKADLFIMVDFGSGYLDAINKNFIESQCLVLDHHQLQGEPASGIVQVNPHVHGLKGASDLSGSGVSYLVAKAVDGRNADLSCIAVVGALGDMQDRNKRRELLSVNKMIVTDGVANGVLREETDLLFYGRETRPLARALASTFNPFISGLSGEEDKCLGFLRNLKPSIELKVGERLRAIADLTTEEKQQIISALAEHLVTEGVNQDAALNLIGSVYTLSKEDRFSPLRDGREFASFLNACGRTDKAGLGIAVCMGDRTSAFLEAQDVLVQYRRTLSEGLAWLHAEPGRIEKTEYFYLVKGEGVIDEKIIGSISTILTTSGTFEPDRPVIALTKTKENTIKVSSRGNELLINKGLNLGEIMQKASEAVQGSGGGHNIAAGAQIPTGSEESFLKLVKDMISQSLNTGGTS